MGFKYGKDDLLLFQGHHIFMGNIVGSGQFTKIHHIKADKFVYGKPGLAVVFPIAGFRFTIDIRHRRKLGQGRYGPLKGGTFLRPRIIGGEFLGPERILPGCMPGAGADYHFAVGPVPILFAVGGAER
jgi:hypothetical protein